MTSLLDSLHDWLHPLFMAVPSQDDGMDFLERACAAGGSSYDIVMVDVAANQKLPEDGQAMLVVPPPPYVSNSTLRLMKDVLRPHGVLALNAIATASSPLDLLQVCLCEADVCLNCFLHPDDFFSLCLEVAAWLAGIMSCTYMCLDKAFITSNMHASFVLHCESWRCVHLRVQHGFVFLRFETVPRSHNNP